MAVKCPKCGLDSPDNASQCGSCGAAYADGGSAEHRGPPPKVIGSRTVRLAVLAVVVLVVVSLTSLYFFTDVFEQTTLRNTISVSYLGGDLTEAILYRVWLNETGELLMSGNLMPNESATCRYNEFWHEEVVFWYSLTPAVNWVCPYLISDDQRLQITIFPSGGLGWETGTFA